MVISSMKALCFVFDAVSGTLKFYFFAVAMCTIMLHRTTERTPTANRTAVLPCYQPCFRDTNRASVSPYYQSQYYVTVSPCYRITERTPTLPFFRVTVLANAFLRYCASVLPTVLFCNIRAPNPLPLNRL